MQPSVLIKAFLDPQSETFSYVVSDPISCKGIIIDPVLNFDYSSGRTATTNAEEIYAYLLQQQLTIEWVLETHAHADHLSAAQFFRERCNAKIGIGAGIKQVQQVFQTVFNLEKEFLPNGAVFDRLFHDGEQLQVGNLTIRILHTPGHTPADLVYIINEEAAFVGDTLFMPDVGTARCDFPGGNARTLYQSIQKILALPEQLKLYICHDYPPQGRSYEYQTTVAQQRQNNIHVKQGTSEAEFVAKREARDATLNMPQLIIPSIQVNIRAGQMPPPEANGAIYFKLPINQL